jgi:hypothetical protein
VGIEAAAAAVAVVNAPSRRCIAVEDGASGPSAFGLPWRSGARMTLRWRHQRKGRRYRRRVGGRREIKGSRLIESVGWWSRAASVSLGKAWHAPLAGRRPGSVEAASSCAASGRTSSGTPVMLRPIRSATVAVAKRGDQRMKSTGRAVVLGDNGFDDGGELRDGVKAA